MADSLLELLASRIKPVASHDQPSRVERAARKATSIGPAVGAEKDWSMAYENQQPDIIGGILNSVVDLGNLGDGGALHAIMPLGSPMRSPAFRAAAHERLLQGFREAMSGPEYTPELRQAVMSAVQRFQQEAPHLLAHVPEAIPMKASQYQDIAGVYRQTVPAPSVSMGELGISPAHIPDPEAVYATMAHELGHAAQNVRQADRARRLGEPGFQTLYDEAKRRLGSWRNPYEQRSRLTQEQRRMKFTNPRALVGNPEGQAQAARLAEDRLQQNLPVDEGGNYPVTLRSLVDAITREVLGHD